MKTIRFWFTALLSSLLVASAPAALYNPQTGGALDRAGAVFIKQIAAGVNDIASGSTTETVAATFSLPALGVNDGVDVEFFTTGSGNVGSKGWNLRLGGTGVNGTVVANYSMTSTTPAGRSLMGFINVNNTSVQEGENVNGYGAAAGPRTGAVDTSVPTTLYLTVVKGTGTDVINLRVAKLIIRRGV